MNITGSTRLAEITALFPAAKGVFEEHGLDPELLADTALADAVEGTGVSVRALIAEIRRAARRELGAEHFSADLEAVTVEDIADLIVDSCHPAVDRSLDAGGALLASVLLLEGDDHPELYQTGREFERLRGLVRNHMAETRGIVFPQLLGTGPHDKPDEALRHLDGAHLAIQDALTSLREIAMGFEPPEDAPDEWRACCLGLIDLEADVQRLVHLEASRLAPAVRECEAGY
jgi:iron-sulfur cluster repair protein YtfE (RIC family)